MLQLGTTHRCSTWPEVKTNLRTRRASLFDVLFFLIALGAGIFLLLVGLESGSFWYTVMGIFWVGLAGVVLLVGIPRAYNQIFRVPKADIIYNPK